MDTLSELKIGCGGMWQVRLAGTSVAERIKFDDLEVTYFEFLCDRICLASRSMLEVMVVKIKRVLEMYEILSEKIVCIL